MNKYSYLLFYLVVIFWNHRRSHPNRLIGVLYELHIDN
nr:MAG TPA: hypothetical protein [Bacteriophage sp.]